MPVSTRREKKQFFQFPWELYQGNPNWVPPLRVVEQELLNYRPHPFYDDAEIQTFLALREGRPCGRLAAMVNHAHNRRYDEKRGFFGFFESIDDHEVAGRLFDAAKSWFLQRGIESIRGPLNPSLNYECALLVDGFDQPPWFMMPYNQPYYDRLIRACGFRKAQDMVAFWGHVDMLRSLSEKLQMMSRMVEDRFGVKCRRFDLKRFEEEIFTFQKIYNSALASTWGFVPLSDAEVRKQAADMKRMIAPELTTIAEIDGKPVGAMLGLLDYNPRIQAIDGRLFPFGFLKLLRNKRRFIVFAC